MQRQIAILKATRANILKQIEDVSLTQLNEIPAGFNNNLIWNAGHVAVTQQLLCYAMSGVEVKLPKEIITAYRKGAKPEKAITQTEVDQIKAWLTASIDWLAEDLEAGVFKTYKEYQTSYGFKLTSMADAVSFNNVHEGMHLGYMIALRKKLGL